MWWYTCSVLVLWVVNSELRRLYDWRFGFAAVEFISLLPLVAMVPYVWSLTIGHGWRRLSRPVSTAAWLWVGAFGYALFMAFRFGNVAPGVYAFANFVFPMALGLWVAADRATSSETAYRRITNCLFGLTTIVSVYGIVQYVIVPPWDALWLQNVIAHGETSFGRPVPFQVRVFSMLNSPGPFGNYLAVALLVALPQLSVRRPWLLLAIPVWLVAFGLSLDRSGWLMFATGALIYIALAPRRLALLSTTALSAAFFGGLMMILPSLVGSDTILSTFSDRLATLSNLEEDQSGAARLDLYSEGLGAISAAPLGRGLGVTGTATKLASTEASTAVDSGILSRFVEMGVGGVAIQIASFAVILSALLGLWSRAGIMKHREIQTLASMGIALELALFAFQASGDVSGLLALLLWASVGLALRPEFIERVTRVPADSGTLVARPLLALPA